MLSKFQVQMREKNVGTNTIIISINENTFTRYIQKCKHK